MKICPTSHASSRNGFGLVEVLLASVIIAVFIVMLLSALSRTLDWTAEAKSASNLRQLTMAALAYSADNNSLLFRYRENTPLGVRWFFGFENRDSLSMPEGQRQVNRNAGPLAPYIDNAHWVSVCPGFLKYRSLRKPKYGDWVTGGYGLNAILTGGVFGVQQPARVAEIQTPSDVWIFGTCAQINTFQPPASPSNPMLEEFYFFDQRETTVHFRFGSGRRALFSHLDGSVRPYAPLAAENDTRMHPANVERATPKNSFTHLR